jgi:hypothetical protein
MFGTTARPGNKLTNGIIFGVGLATASLLMGFVSRFAPDNVLFISLSSVCIVANVGYFFIDGA